MKAQKYKTYLTALTVIMISYLTGATVVTQAANVVDWGGNYISAQVELDGGGGDYTTAGQGLWVYNETTRTSPSTGYTAPAGKSGPFYWGGYTLRSDGAGSASQRNWSINDVMEGGANDYIRFYRGNNTAGLSYSGAVFVAFTSDNFLEYVGSSVSFDLASSITLNASSATSASYRFAIKDSGQWYLSENYKTTTGVFEMSGNDLLTSTWGIWSPTGGATGRLGDVPVTFGAVGSSFTNIEAFGVYTGFNGNSAGSINAQIVSFRVNAIPEPASLSLLGLAVGVIVFGTQKHRKKNLK
ncbi:MAG: hypothetical protein ACK5LK_09200 [Chthoniobacterales bacterium]